MPEPNESSPDIGELFGVDFSPDRLAQNLVAYRDILAEIRKLRELDLTESAVWRWVQHAKIEVSIPCQWVGRDDAGNGGVAEGHIQVAVGDCQVEHHAALESRDQLCHQGAVDGVDF